jgi:hypothetical protein
MTKKCYSSVAVVAEKSPYFFFGIFIVINVEISLSLN